MTGGGGQRHRRTGGLRPELATSPRASDTGQQAAPWSHSWASRAEPGQTVMTGMPPPIRPYRVVDQGSHHRLSPTTGVVSQWCNRGAEDRELVLGKVDYICRRIRPGHQLREPQN
jgi:hypothetical protein